MSIDFVRSSFCASNACVEVAFHKATASGCNGNCVEVGACDCGVVVRDSKDPDGPRLTFTAEEWAAFLAGVKAEEFELPVA